MKPDQKRLLDVAQSVSFLVDTNIRVLIGGVDVLHSWFVLVFSASSSNAMPGRVNETWMWVEYLGTF